MTTDPNPSKNPLSAGTNPDAAQKATVTHNLDTGRDEPLKTDEEDEDVMDFASGSDGGGAGDGSGA